MLLRFTPFWADAEGVQSWNCSSRIARECYHRVVTTSADGRHCTPLGWVEEHLRIWGVSITLNYSSLLILIVWWPAADKEKGTFNKSCYKNDADILAHHTFSFFFFSILQETFRNLSAPGASQGDPATLTGTQEHWQITDTVKAAS